jgi:NitT/TauT family transport system substrate-binding protein
VRPAQRGPDPAATLWRSPSGIGYDSQTMSPPRLAATSRAARLLVLVLLALLSGCNRAPAGGGSGPAAVKLALDWVPEPEFGGFYAGRDTGAYRRGGLEIEILGGGAGVPVVQMVAARRADFGVIGADELITARTRGADVIPIFATFQTFPQAIMVHASRGAKSLSDVLASGTVAMDPGVPYAAFLRKKYPAAKAKFVPYDGGVARFVSDKDFAQQCFISSEPVAAARQGSDPQVFRIADEGYNPYTTVVITSRALWKEKPDQVRAFARASREGWRAYLDDPAPANAVMARLNTAMDAETWAAAAIAQKPLIESEETRKGKLGVMTRARWETLGQQLVESGVIPAAPPVDDYLISIGD